MASDFDKLASIPKPAVDPTAENKTDAAIRKRHSIQGAMREGTASFIASIRARDFDKAIAKRNVKCFVPMKGGT